VRTGSTGTIAGASNLTDKSSRFERLTMENRTTSAPGDTKPEWPWFLAWLLVGGAFALALCSLLSIGLFVLPVPVVASVLLLRRGATRACLGLLSGAGFPLLYVAYLNRGGPGDVCSPTNGGQVCTDELTPWPLLAAGLILLIGGAVLFRRRLRAAHP
jgi:hypothetical protein